MVEVCLLGSGGMMPLPNRWLTALLYRYHGKMVLIDCGEGTQIPIKLVGWGFKNIEAICFTHYHADHISGLPGLLLTMGNYGRIEPLTILGPPMLREIIQSLTIIAQELPFEIKLIELSDKASATNSIGDIFIHSIPVEHTIPCLSYCIEIKRAGKFQVEMARKHDIPMQFWGRLQKGEIIQYKNQTYYPEMVLGEPRKGIKVSYCTDTRPIEALADFVRDSDLLICEGMYGEEAKLEKAVEKKHMLFSEAAAIALKGSVKELWLTHFSPALANPEEFYNNAKHIFANTILGKNLLRKTIHFEE